MVKLGIRTARKALQLAHDVRHTAAASVGLEQPLETIEEGLTRLPVVDDVVRAAKIVADQIAPEKLPLYKEASGPEKVGVHREKFRDEVRGRNIPMTVYYPKESEEDSPVVVFSHGFGGNEVTYSYIGRHLASHGYTVLQPTHEGSDTLSFMKRLPTSSFTQRELKARTEDVSFSLDLLESEQLPSQICENADLSRVALAGHSFGALTAQAMAGLKTKTSDGESVSFKDQRIDSFVAMSPYGDSAPTHLLGLDVDTYDEIEQPILYISGDKDRLFTLGRGHKVHSMPYQETASPDKYNLVVDGARHLDFAQSVGLLDRETARMTKSTTLAFLDAHLKEDSKALSYLQDELPKVARSRDSLAQTK